MSSRLHNNAEALPMHAMFGMRSQKGTEDKQSPKGWPGRQAGKSDWQTSRPADEQMNKHTHYLTDQSDLHSGSSLFTRTSGNEDYNPVLA